MKPALKFIKDNLVPLLCGFVVLLGLLAWLVWPLPGMKDQLQTTMADRYNNADQANKLIRTITMPGGQVLTNVTYEPNIIDAAAKAQKSMSNQAAAIIKTAAAQNQKDRVRIVNNKTVPLLGDQLEDNFLPAIDRSIAEPYAFKTDYEKQFSIWMTQLIGKDNVPGTPPTQTEIQNELAAEHARAAAPIAGNPMFAGAAAAAGATDPAELLRYTRTALSRRAGDIKMYVDFDALQHRSWYNTQTPPTESQIFEALVDCWFQQDVIHAILDVNKNSPNVGQSPIKRLRKIIVGASTGGQFNASGLFFTSGPAAPGAAPATPVADLTKTMTGRTSNAQYDVVLMNISVDLDPAYQNAFIDALYKQNNGYTVLNIVTRVMDPFEAASNGYLYGYTQVVHEEILVEGLLFRSWTVPIMPDATRDSLGLPRNAVPPVVPPA